MVNSADSVIFYGWLSVSPAWKAKIRLNPWHFSPFKEDLNEIIVPAGLTVRKPLTGWCSWYAFCDTISEQKILNQAEFVFRNRDRLPLDFILIDDGWTKYGDWGGWDQKRFPQGPTWLGSELKKRGFKFGLWFAPFLVGTDSVLFKEHKDWLVKDKKGNLVVGYRLLPFNIGPIKYILDGQNEEAMQYLFSCIDRMINEWGIGLLKCDFLYAPYFDPKLKNSEIPNTIVKRLLGYIRSNYPEVATVASGPVAQMVDLVDATYFAENTFSPPLDGIWPLNVLHHSFRLHQVEKAFRLREGIKKLFNLDPDVFACRDSLGLNANQIERLVNLIKKTNGDIFLGDDLTKLPDWKIDKYITPLLTK